VTSRRRKFFTINSNPLTRGFAWAANRHKLNPDLPLREASAKAPETTFDGAFSA
jgi:hypothetical protein